MIAVLDAFGVELGDVGKGMTPLARRLIAGAPGAKAQAEMMRMTRKRAQFARLHPPGTQDVPIRRLRAIQGPSQRKMAASPRGTHSERTTRVQHSFAAEGQHEPVEVRSVAQRNQPAQSYFDEGHHRVEAAHRLGWPTLRTTVTAQERR